MQQVCIHSSTKVLSIHCNAIGGTETVTNCNSMLTVTEFTAAAVRANFELFIQPLMSSGDDLDVGMVTLGDSRQMQPGGWDLFVSGGGARNKTLMRYSVLICSSFECIPVFQWLYIYRHTLFCPLDCECLFRLVESVWLLEKRKKK